jgi:steroid 5-alpha reductase family enzyme
MFIPAFIFKTDKLTDISYGIGFIATAIFAYSQGFPNVLGVFLLFMVIMWGVRISMFLFIKINLLKRDIRFDGIRENFFSFLRFWILQGLTIWIILTPAIIFFGTKNIDYNRWIFFILGIIVWFKGFVIETIADYQKSRFKTLNSKKTAFVNIGLWKYSRHPNYLGEMLCWIGVFLFAIPAMNGLSYLSVIGPLWIIFLLLFVTGIPTLEKQYDVRYKNNKEYQEYKRNTSVLLILPKKK